LFDRSFQIRLLPHNLVQGSHLHPRFDELLKGRARFDGLVLSGVTD